MAEAIWASEHCCTPASFAAAPGGQAGREAGQVLVAVVAGQAHLEGRVGAGVVVQRTGLKARIEGRGAAGQGPPSTPRSIVVVALRLDRLPGGGVLGVVGGVGDEAGGRGVLPAGGRGDQRGAGAFAEVQLEAVIGQLGQAFEGADQPAGARVGLDPARLLDDDAALGDAGDDVEGYQGVEGIVVGGGDVEGALQRLGDQRGGARDRADLGGLRAAFPRC